MPSTSTSSNRFRPIYLHGDLRCVARAFTDSPGPEVDFLRNVGWSLLVAHIPDLAAKGALLVWIRVQTLVRKIARTIEKAFVGIKVEILTILSLRSPAPAQENLVEHLVSCQMHVVAALRINAV